MRPAVAGDTLETWPRKPTSTTLASPLNSRQPGPTVYFLADERAVQASAASSQCVMTGKSPKDSTYGVRSLDEASSVSASVHELDRQAEDISQQPGRAEDEIGPQSSQMGNDLKTVEGQSASSNARPDHGTTQPVQMKPSTSSTASSPPTSVRQRAPDKALSRPLTPLFTSSPEDGTSDTLSARSSSLKSSRHSDSGSVVDDAASQALGSSDDDYAATSDIHDSTPQLIMPSIKMPSRRPFTEEGKKLGRLKVLIVGESGIGKTSLIKSIVQTCNDIVHVDPISSDAPNPRSKPAYRARKGKMPTQQGSTSQILEVYASTRPYPSWWSDVDDTRVLRRRKSLGDTVLERNLCFVDTPGYRKHTSSAEYLEPIMKYLEAQYQRSLSLRTWTDGDISGLLSGSGGSQVDVAFYLMSASPKAMDLTAITQLSTITNVIPLIAKADTIPSENLLAAKAEVLQALRSAGIRPFLFGRSHQEALSDLNSLPPFGVSSATSSDAETMDASLLMSPDYVQPLMASELNILVERVFQQDSVAWLRHAAAKKIIHWRNGTLAETMNTILPSPFSLDASSPGLNQLDVLRFGSRSCLSTLSLSSSSQVLVSPHGAATSYALARVADHTQREERVAQLRLAKWAHDLHRSLQNERERFEALARGERAIWLTERLGECVLDGTLVPATDGPQRALSRPLVDSVSATTAEKMAAHRAAAASSGLDTRDPLGLLQLHATIKRNGWLVVQVVGSFGIAGGLAVWMAKTLGSNEGGFTFLNWNWRNGAD